MKKICLLFALVNLLVIASVRAISLDAIQLWAGSGTNRAALVIEWSSPQVFNTTTEAPPIADKTLVWGYRFNGTNASGADMLKAILGADPRLYVIADNSFGIYVEGIGYNLNGNGNFGVTDGTNIFSAVAFTNGILNDPNLSLDGASPLNPGDLFWSGYFGPSWEVWTETGDSGGLVNSPNRGTNTVWTPDDPGNPYSGQHGQWELAQAGLSDLPLHDGSWIGYSVAAGGFDYSDPDGAGTTAYNLHKHAPISPDGNYVAYVESSNDFAAQIVSTNGVYATSPYNDPTAMLDRPSLLFVDHFGDKANHRVKIVEAPYWTAPDGGNLITEINSGGQVTVKLGRKVYDDPNNPYGIDLIIYGNSFFSAFGASGFISDATDLGAASLSTGIFGHPTTVSVSPDGTNWYSFPNIATIFPEDAYRWDDANHAWTQEQSNPTKPLNPFITGSVIGGQIVADGLDQFVGAAGGTGYDLKASGFSWVQYVRLEPGSNAYTVIDAIAAVNPVVVGDALSISPTNIVSGITNLAFQSPADFTRNLISLNFSLVSDVAKISTVTLSDLSSFAPLNGNISSAYQITASPVTGTNAITLLADVALRTGADYAGNGGNLRVWQWNGTTWNAAPFTFNAATSEVMITNVTHLSAFVVAQLPAPSLAIQIGTNGLNFQFIPSANATYALERSTDLQNWTPVASATPTNTQPVTLQDLNPPADKAFYRLHVTQ